MVGTRLYVGGLSHRVTERDLERFFRDYGRLRDVIIKNGFGFVEFEDYRDADDAVYELNGKDFMGERVLVELARGSKSSGSVGGRGVGGGSGGSRSYKGSYNSGAKAPWMEKYGLPTRTNYRLIVENLSTRVSWQDLKDFMRQAGDVTYADAHKTRKNEGVVEFSTHADMRNALLKLDGKDLQGRRIRLIDDSRRKQSSRSYSSSRSHSRSRSRSRSSRSRSRSRSHKRRNRSHSRSPSKEKSRSKSALKVKSRTRSKEKSRSRTLSKARSRTRSKLRSRSSSKLRSRSRSKERSRTHSNEKSRSRSERSRSKSRTPYKSRSRTKSRSLSHSRNRDISHSRSRSLSRSRSRSSKTPLDESSSVRSKSPSIIQNGHDRKSDELY